MKQTLLAIVQDILSSMDGDEINSINDNVEAQQVVAIVRRIYNDIIDRADLRNRKTLFTLTSSGNSSFPTIMYVPTAVSNIDWIKYNRRTSTDTDDNWTIINYLPPSDFFVLLDSLKVSSGTVTSFTYSSTTLSAVTLFCNNNTGPTYYTSLDDNTLIFDSYDTGVDSTLQTSKTLCYGEQTTAFTAIDTWVPLLEDHQFSLLVHEAVALAHAEMKQAANVKAEKMGRQQWIHLQRAKRTVPRKVPAINSLPNYGRKGGYRTDLGVDQMIKAMREGS